MPRKTLSMTFQEEEEITTASSMEATKTAMQSMEVTMVALIVVCLADEEDIKNISVTTNTTMIIMKPIRRD